MGTGSQEAEDLLWNLVALITDAVCRLNLSPMHVLASSLQSLSYTDESAVFSKPAGHGSAPGVFCLLAPGTATLNPPAELARGRPPGSISKFSFHRGLFRVRLLQQVRHAQRGWVASVPVSASATQTSLSTAHGVIDVCYRAGRSCSPPHPRGRAPGLRVCMGCAAFTFPPHESPREDRSPSPVCAPVCLARALRGGAALPRPLVYHCLLAASCSWNLSRKLMSVTLTSRTGRLD